MALWKFGKSKKKNNHSITTGYLGEALAEMFDPARVLNVVTDWHRCGGHLIW
jgi:hypothetical protein